MILITKCLREANDSHGNAHNRELPNSAQLCHHAPPSRSTPFPLSWMGRWYRIASGSWPCPLLATAKLNPVLEPGQEIKSFLNKIQIFCLFFCYTHTHHYPSTSFFNCWVCEIWGLLGKISQWFWETKSHSFLQNNKIPRSQKCTNIVSHLLFLKKKICPLITKVQVYD